MRPSKLEYKIVKLFHTHTKILNNLHNQYIKHVCENGGDILEIGFGGGVTADMIQNYNIKTHTIPDQRKLVESKFPHYIQEWITTSKTKNIL